MLTYTLVIILLISMHDNQDPRMPYTMNRYVQYFTP